MSKHKGSKRRGLANPSDLNSFDASKGLLLVVLETPKGSRNKFAFDERERIFELKKVELKKVLPAGMAFPCDFGFVPSTKADDGDPVDVLVLMDDAFPGCVLSCRPIGVIQGKQGNKKRERVMTELSPWSRMRTAGQTQRPLMIWEKSSAANSTNSSLIITTYPARHTWC
jgi:inorganic pyrophosphatase